MLGSVGSDGRSGSERDGKASVGIAGNPGSDSLNAGSVGGDGRSGSERLGKASVGAGGNLQSEGIESPSPHACLPWMFAFA